jgi:hypothetical protein
MAALFFGFAFDAARFAGTARPYWQLVAIACVFLPLLALGGLSPVRADARPRLVLVFGGCLGTLALGVYVVAFSSAALGGLGALDEGGLWAGLAISAIILAVAAVVELVAGLLALRSGNGHWGVPPLSRLR